MGFSTVDHKTKSNIRENLKVSNVIEGAHVTIKFEKQKSFAKNWKKYHLPLSLLVLRYWHGDDAQDGEKDDGKSKPIL